MEWNGTSPFPEPILAFGFGMEWNGVEPEKGIFSQYSEPTGPADSAGRVELQNNVRQLTLI